MEGYKNKTIFGNAEILDKKVSYYKNKSQRLIRYYLLIVSNLLL